MTLPFPSYNSVILPGGSTSFGFDGNWTTANNAPSDITLGNAVCAVKSGRRQASWATARG
ncbi:cellulose binding domain-containing protein [Kitasatospora sp. CB02891]|uniref:cellulose binding domain-containing protein n=1 Tax=Kitasatospora sp. CB02891 TaxID=2020329 RepID=UPI001E34429B|nr:cellulose binding domain-containing protein [Kitasatospora sp. CB02891]